VVKGKNRGARLLGFPTANLELVDELIPKRGVYAVRVTADDRTYNGLTNIGYNPTFGEGSFSVETHLLDFSGDLFGKTMKVNFIARIRDEKTFRTPKDLGDQIARDVRKATELLGKSRNLPSK
jgi:riboflavin kinase/FMN adenylyltransferase